MAVNMMNNTTNASNSSLPVSTLNVSYREQILVAVLMGVVAITGLIGNSMIIAAVAFSKKLQTSTNAFVTSLGIADLLTSFILIWFIVGILGKGEWPIKGAYWICRFTGFMLFASIGTSMWTLNAISINRLIHIAKPIWYNKIFTSWKLVILVLIPWIIPAACLLTLIAIGHVAFGYNNEELICAHMNIKSKNVFVYVQSVVGLLLPFPAIVASYIWIYIYVKKHFGVQKQHLSMFFTSSMADDLQSNIQSPTSEFVITESGYDPNSAIAVRRKKQILNEEIEITKNLFIAFVAFIVCFIPYFAILAFESSPTTKRIEYYINIVPWANYFFIYAMKHPDFKVVLRYMMRCSFADIPQPSPILYTFKKKMKT